MGNVVLVLLKTNYMCIELPFVKNCYKNNASRKNSLTSIFTPPIVKIDLLEYFDFHLI